MSTARKRVQKNTVQGFLETFQSVATIPEPTLPLTDLELSHFNRVMSSREIATWTPHDVSTACLLSKAMRRQEEINERLDSEGLTLTNDRGTTVAHPLLSASMAISNTIQALTRTLGLSASQRALTGGAQKSRNQADAAARDVIERAAKDDLLA